MQHRMKGAECRCQGALCSLGLVFSLTLHEKVSVLQKEMAIQARQETTNSLDVFKFRLCLSHSFSLVLVFTPLLSSDCD